MSIRTVSIGAPFGWLMKAVDVGRKNPRALFGGFALLLLVGLVPGVIQMAGQAMFPASPGVVMTIYALSLLLSLVLGPPMVGSAFVLMHACERGQPAGATDIFDGFRDRSFAVRMWLTALLMLVIYLGVFVLLYFVMPGKEFFGELMIRSAGLAPGQQPDLTGMPAFPPSFLLWMLLAGLVVLVLSNAYMLAFARAALNARGALAATLDGFVSTFKNILPFLAIAIVLTVVGTVAIVILALVAGIGLGLLMAISPVLAVIVGVPIYVGLMLLVYAVAFGYYYHAWTASFAEPAVARDDELAV